MHALCQMRMKKESELLCSEHLHRTYLEYNRHRYLLEHVHILHACCIQDDA